MYQTVLKWTCLRIDYSLLFFLLNQGVHLQYATCTKKSRDQCFLSTMSWNLANAKNWQSTEKLSYTRNLRGNTFKGDILWQFDFLNNKVVWFVLAAMREGILLPSNMAAKSTFCLYRVKSLVVTLRCSVNVTTSSFQRFPLSLLAKLVFRKR